MTKLPPAIVTSPSSTLSRRSLARWEPATGAFKMLRSDPRRLDLVDGLERLRLGGTVDRDVRHAGGVRTAVPVLFSLGDDDHVAWLDDVLLRFRSDDPLALDDDQALLEGMGV